MCNIEMGTLLIANASWHFTDVPIEVGDILMYICKDDNFSTPNQHSHVLISCRKFSLDKQFVALGDVDCGECHFTTLAKL